eukprot:CAMPEP_0202448950 /NCGR_PEP_ID=MMETSP1360-20130828/7742_1 /ASSEMBLY_ACC=CAM_ASM_000848 /TAXON_ID=515479 /ORGANISM="Licmophora paradoxa, Strain CCMP2313" /LENGTH=211 /DNA_ID=CAMNT_0049066743 /DNA_START=194 /DNA_END=829 /DNA_ORIENTATION=+
MRILLAILLPIVVTSFTLLSTSTNHATSRERRTSLKALPVERRSMMGAAFASVGILMTTFAAPPPAMAIPMITTTEFEIVLKDSARSIQVVEFAGSAGDTVTARLVDGTVFGISDVVESPTDPRSPLKIAALCRQAKVPTKFMMLEAALTKTTKKKKVYMNSIVQEAAIKEEEKRERMRLDEEDRLAALYKMEEEEAKRLLERQTLQKTQQ